MLPGLSITTAFTNILIDTHTDSNCTFVVAHKEYSREEPVQLSISIETSFARKQNESNDDWFDGSKWFQLGMLSKMIW